jgi:hypothetical protein
MLPSALRTLPLNGLRYSQTTSPARVTSYSSPPVPAAISVLRFASRCAPEMNRAKKSAGCFARYCQASAAGAKGPPSSA